MAEIDNEPASKRPKAADAPSSESDTGDESECPEPDYFEYSDIKNKSQLDRHLGNTRKHAIQERRYKLTVMESAIKAWYLTPGKHVSIEVTNKFK